MPKIESAASVRHCLETTIRINRINGNHLRTLCHYSTVYFQFIVSIVCMYDVRCASTCIYRFCTQPLLPLTLPSSILCSGYFIFCERLVMPLRDQNFYAKSTQKKYLRKPMFNIRNLYLPFFTSGRNIKQHCECVCVFIN